MKRVHLPGENPAQQRHRNRRIPGGSKTIGFRGGDLIPDAYLPEDHSLLEDLEKKTSDFWANHLHKAIAAGCEEERCSAPQELNILDIIKFLKRYRTLIRLSGSAQAELVSIFRKGDVQSHDKYRIKFKRPGNGGWVVVEVQELKDQEVQRQTRIAQQKKSK